MLKEKFKRIKWNEGVSEMLSFAIVVPFVVILICAILSSTQLSIEKQRLSYATYSVCRAGVVCENETYAEARTDAVMQELYGDDFIDGGFNATLGSNPENGDTYYKLELIGTGSEWKKENMARCTVYRYITPVMPFTAGYRTETIVMMIENGVDSAVDVGETS